MQKGGRFFCRITSRQMTAIISVAELNSKKICHRESLAGDDELTGETVYYFPHLLHAKVQNST